VKSESEKQKVKSETKEDIKIYRKISNKSAQLFISSLCEDAITYFNHALLFYYWFVWYAINYVVYCEYYFLNFIYFYINQAHHTTPHTTPHHTPHTTHTTPHHTPHRELAKILTSFSTTHNYKEYSMSIFKTSYHPPQCNKPPHTNTNTNTHQHKHTPIPTPTHQHTNTLYKLQLPTSHHPP
jgi:hypothetical protein